MTRTESTVMSLPRPGGLSAPLEQLRRAVEGLRAQDAVDMPGPQALHECQVLLAELDRLKAVVLTRVADVDRRRLHELDDAPSTSTWIARQESGLDRGEVTLARRLDRFPHLADRVGDGLSLDAATRIASALSRVRPLVDRPDGLIDGQPGEQVIAAVVLDGALAVICQAKGGLDEASPALRRLRAELTAIADGTAASQLQRLERAFTVVAVNVEPAQLTGALATLVDALLPLQLEERSDQAHRDRGLTLTRQHGAGWLLRGELDDETGELLHTALMAARSADPENPVDTQVWRSARDAGADTDDVMDRLGCAGAPRSRRQREHDALRLALRALLGSASLGERGKAAPHIGIVVGLDTLHEAAGALPARGDSGQSLPLSLVRRWMCDSYLTRYVLSRGRKVVESSHTERTLRSHERRIKQLETGGQCQGAGCTRGPGTALIPHHVTPWAVCGTTSIDDTVLLCEATHHDLHTGGKTIALKDGRRLNERGWVQ